LAAHRQQLLLSRRGDGVTQDERLLLDIEKTMILLEEADTSETMGIVAAYMDTLPESRMTVTLNQEDFLRVVSAVKPSVSSKDLEYYDQLGRQFDSA
jgi:SpoVK/Ycf46/Vps4 family AAA+-type ATPase